MPETLLCPRNLAFELYEVLDAEALTQRERFADHSRETFNAAVDTARSIAENLFAPHNRKADENEPIYKDGEAVLIPEVKPAVDAFIEAGFHNASRSFEDGGSKLKLTGHPMAGGSAETFQLAGEVNGSTELKAGGETYAVEWSGFRPFNVENVNASGDVRAVKKGESLNEQFAATLGKASGSAAKNANNKDFKNVGPSVQYKLRDKTGQAREFLNYMQPVTLEGSQVYLAGVRNSPAEQFSFLRIPADDKYGVGDWMRLRAALNDPKARTEAARRYAERALAPEQRDSGLASQLQESSARTLEIFSGQGGGRGGFVAVAQFLEKIPQAEQEKAANIFMKMLNGTLWELWQVSRVQAGFAPAEPSEANGRFLQLATNALSDSFLYGAPVYLQLEEFTEIKASVLQLTRSPGKKVVYLGCLLLVAGVFAMFYIRERRMWVWVTEHEGGAHALMAMSTQRKTLDFEREFDELKAKLPQR